MTGVRNAGLAIGRSHINPEPVLTPVFSDNYNRADGGVGANYSGSGFQIISNMCYGSGSFTRGNFYIGNLTANHYVEFETHARITNRTGPAMAVRDGYFTGWHNGSAWVIGTDAMSFGVLASTAESLPALPFKTRLVANGTSIKLYQFTGGVWVLKVSYTTATHLTEQLAGVMIDRVSTESFHDNLVVGTVT